MALTKPQQTEILETLDLVAVERNKLLDVENDLSSYVRRCDDSVDLAAQGAILAMIAAQKLKGKDAAEAIAVLLR